MVKGIQDTLAGKPTEPQPQKQSGGMNISPEGADAILRALEQLFMPRSNALTDHRRLVLALGCSIDMLAEFNAFINQKINEGVRLNHNANKDVALLLRRHPDTDVDFLVMPRVQAAASIKPGDIVLLPVEGDEPMAVVECAESGPDAGQVVTLQCYGDEVNARYIQQCAPSITWLHNRLHSIVLPVLPFQLTYKAAAVLDTGLKASMHPAHNLQRAK